MKRYIYPVLLCFIALSTGAQTLKDTSIIQQRSYYLNGGARASLGGKSRTTLKIDLPKNTKRWYYSFTTSPGEDGTKLLNLGVQVAAALTTGGLGKAVASSIQVPEGSSTVDVLILQTQYRDAFLNKEDNVWRFYPDVSLQNSKQAVQSIDETYGNSFYIGLRNPSTLKGVNISIEVVALIEEVNPDSDKGMLYGNLGWKAFERGELDKCVELSKKALTFNKNLCFVKFNIALSHLVQEKDEAIEEYINAISDLKNDRTPNNTLAGALQDLKNIKSKRPDLKNIRDIEDLLNNELRKHR